MLFNFKIKHLHLQILMFKHSFRPNNSKNGLETTWLMIWLNVTGSRRGALSFRRQDLMSVDGRFGEWLKRIGFHFDTPEYFSLIF